MKLDVDNDLRLPLAAAICDGVAHFLQDVRLTSDLRISRLGRLLDLAANSCVEVAMEEPTDLFDRQALAHLQLTIRQLRKRLDKFTGV